MPEVTQHPPGTPSWADLGTTDTGDAKRFYTSLFGWEAFDMPAGEGTYTMLNLRGKPVAALAEQQKEQRDRGIPPAWLTYVTVASADEAATRARSAGGTVLMDPFDVMDVGRMAVISDPSGAPFAVWEPRAHIGAQIVNEPGSITWTELATRDIEGSKSFYRELFGWGEETHDMGPTSYTEFKRGDRSIAGMMPISEEWGQMPPNWMVYFAVDDCDDAVRRAEELGGKVAVQPTDIPDVGRFSVLQDPQGAHFSVMKLARTPD
jgi:predicted enzyme related to lactoylglutathione lyase